MATITVTATDGMGESAMQTIDVTVEAADTGTSLQDIPDSSISVTNNANSAITVSWMGGDNAVSFIVVAAELGFRPVHVRECQRSRRRGQDDHYNWAEQRLQLHNHRNRAAGNELRVRCSAERDGQLGQIRQRNEFLGTL